MDKRGQFYVIIALILSLALFGITYTTNSISEPVLFEDFNMVSGNYIAEATKLVNYAIETETEISLETFTSTYLDYAKQKNPDLGLLYIFGNGNNIEIFNYLDNPINVGNETLSGENEQLIQGITLEIGGKEFAHQVPVKGGEFGKDWTNLGLGNEPFDLSIGGIIHSFEEFNTNALKIIVRTVGGEEYIFDYEEDVLLSPKKGGKVVQQSMNY